MPDEHTPFEPPAESPAAAPPIEAGDFVPVAPPEGWPTVIGVLGIIFGGLGVIQGACGAAGMVMMSFAGGLIPEDSGTDLDAQMQQSFPYPVPQGLQMVAEFGLALVLLVGGIMLLKRSRRSAGVLTTYAWLDLTANTLGAILGYFVITSQVEALKENPDLAQAPAGMAGIMGAIGPVAVAVGWVFAAVWPVFLIIWFRRAKIRASMEAWG